MEEIKIIKRGKVMKYKIIITVFGLVFVAILLIIGYSIGYNNGYKSVLSKLPEIPDDLMIQKIQSIFKKQIAAILVYRTILMKHDLLNDKEIEEALKEWE